MKTFKIGKYEVLELLREGVYEYYVRTEGYPFIMAFGTIKRFPKTGLVNLCRNGYFASLFE